MPHVDEESFGQLLDAMKQAGGVLNDAGIRWALGGGLAAWARGGPETEHDVGVRDRPVGKRQREPLTLRVVRGLDLHEASVADLVVAPPAGVDDVEAAVRGNAGVLEDDLVRVHEREALHRCDRDARDRGGHPLSVVPVPGAVPRR